jgi:hypothetical protein
MHSSDLRDLFRADIDDAVAPYLWSDAEVASYMDDAQKMFCRLTGGIGDATSNLCSVDISAGEDLTTFDPRILKIRRMQRDSDSEKIEIINFEDLDALRLKLDSQTGPVDRAIIGMEPYSIRWMKIPVVDDTASLIVYRLPLRTISPTVRSLLEIPEQHQRHLMLWMKSLAYAKQDSDTLDKTKAEKNETLFRNYCAAAKAEAERLRHTPRTVVYGGL